MRVTLTVTSGPASGKTFEFTQSDTLLFGRASDAHIQILGDKLVSRNHFSLLISESECCVRDLDSANGTYLGRAGKYSRYGGKSPLPPGAIEASDGALEIDLLDGDVISVGETKLTVHIEAPDDKTLVQKAAPDDLDRTMIQKAAPDDAKAAAATLATERYAQPIASILPTVMARPAPNAPQFDGYECLAKIGEGGMGFVIKARRTTDGERVKSGQIVAIKTMIPPKGPNASRAIDAFEREIRVHSGLKHPNIVDLIEVVRTRSLLGVVLEFVDGMDLGKFVQSRGGKVPIADAAPLMLDVLSGLAHAHSAGIIHRDLKPENIFLTKDSAHWVAKVADFGLAKSYEASGKSLFEIAGTPPYWPREHITAYAQLYPASDVFSIAAVFYWMLTGVHAREGMSEMLSKLAAAGRRPGFGDYTQVITSGKIVPIAQRLPALPAVVSAVFDRALKEEELPRAIQNDKNALRAKLAEMRFPNAGAFRDALATALHDQQLRKTPQDNTVR